MGYHQNPIPKGTLGDFSKIEEEFLELKDAWQQGNKVLYLCELADLIGAIDLNLQKEFKGALTLEDIHTMTLATAEAFEQGERQ